MESNFNQNVLNFLKLNLKSHLSLCTVRLQKTCVAKHAPYSLTCVFFIKSLNFTPPFCKKYRKKQNPCTHLIKKVIGKLFIRGEDFSSLKQPEVFVNVLWDLLSYLVIAILCLRYSSALHSLGRRSEASEGCDTKSEKSFPTMQQRPFLRRPSQNCNILLVRVDIIYKTVLTLNFLYIQYVIPVATARSGVSFRFSV